MGNKNNTSIKSLFAENTAPALLSAAVMSSASYVYACGSGIVALLFALMSTVYSAVLFALYEFLRRRGKTWLTVVTVTAVMTAVNAAAVAIIRDPSQVGLWFMEPSRFTRVYYDNSTAFILSVGFILISCLYYFTRVRYRGLFVFLICMCPFCLFAKTFTEIPVLFPVLIMTLFFFIMMSNSKAAKVTAKSRYGAAFPFIFVVTAIAAFAPKIQYAPYREVFDEFVTGVSLSTAGIADLSDFSDSSSNTTSRDEDTVVFRFDGDNPGLVKRQCFNIYDRATNTWGYYGNANEGSSGWGRFVRFEDASELDGARSSKKWLLAKIADGNLHAIYTCRDMTDITLVNSDLEVYRTELDEYFIKPGPDDKIQSYLLTWYDTPIDTEFEKKFTIEYAESLDTAASLSYLRAKKQAIQYDEYLFSDEVMDACYSSDAARQRVRILAKQIAADCTTDYEKAKAIEAYFLSGEYIYDKEFTAADASPDNFIFGTKRGACASYATAATLMCRELGITARYCEGLRIQKHDESGAWYSTTGDSHAFVQVWVDGYGWTDIDPTSFTEDGGYFDPTFMYVGITALGAALIVVIISLLRPKMREAAFVRKVNRSRGSQQATLIYRRVNGLLNSYLGNKQNTLTPAETRDKCAELFGADIGGFTEYYESLIYGGIGNENADNSAVYTEFTAAYKNRIKQDRKEKKKKK